MQFVILTNFLLICNGFHSIYAQFWIPPAPSPPVFRIAARDEECSLHCPRVMNPVCAYDGVQSFKFFYSECLLRQQRCEAQKDWTATHLALCLHLLDREVLEQCMRPCRFEFKPVCATNGKRTEIFGNECIYNMENCFHNEKWSKLPEDICSF